MHNLCVFCTFSTFVQKIFKGWGCNFTWSFCKVMRSKWTEMVFVARIIRHKICMIYAFFCSKIVFDQKLFSYCWDEFDYPGSIVYLSCLTKNLWFLNFSLAALEGKSDDYFKNFERRRVWVGVPRIW